MGEIFLHSFPGPAQPVLAPARRLLLEPDDDEDPIECEAVKRHGCAFWRGDWHACGANREARVTAREFDRGGPGYCFFEIRCTRTRRRVARQGWYLNWRTFTPADGMRLIADYRLRPAACRWAAHGPATGRSSGPSER